MQRIAACAIGALVLLSACEAKKPRAGDVCKHDEEGTYVCADQGTGLFCKASRRRAIPCRGPGGCAGGPKPGASLAPFTCDTSLGREGDACVDEESTATVTCSEDKKSRLGCMAGKRVLDALCRGPKGCDPTATPTDERRSCDRSIADVDDPCNLHGSGGELIGACSVDGKNSLHCSDDHEKGRFVVVNVCSGPKGCVMGHLSNTSIPAPVCDRSVATVGAACGKGDSNHLTCSADGSAILRCGHDTKTYGVEQRCGPKATCKHSNSGPFDNNVACAALAER